MGELIMMPKRDSSAEKAVEEQKHTPECITDSAASDRQGSSLDLSVWKRAPKERTAAYFPTYSTVSKAIQTALRGWVREWFNANTEILLRPHSAYAILVYQCTHPFSGRPTNMFTYDIQQTEALNRAFASAAYRLGRELKTLDTKRFRWFTREHYFAYRSKEVVKYVSKNRRALYRMLNVETVLMDSILKFAVMDIPRIGLEEATVLLRRAFNTQLRRFSEEFDLSPRVEELLRVATDALVSKLPSDNVITLPVRARRSRAAAARRLDFKTQRGFSSMTRSNRSAHRTTPLNDFQVFKGRCEQTMQAFGGPVMAHHVARLLVRDDQASAAPGTPALYAIYKRSENRILQILGAPEAIDLKLAA